MEKEIDVFMLCPNCKKITNATIPIREIGEIDVWCKECKTATICTDKFSDGTVIKYDVLSSDNKSLYIPRHISDCLYRNYPKGC